MEEIQLDEGIYVIMNGDLPVGYKKTHDEARTYMNNRVYEIINLHMFKYTIDACGTDEAITLYGKKKSSVFCRNTTLASFRIVHVVNIMN